MKTTTVHSAYTATRATAKMLAAMLQRFERKARDLYESIRAEISATPLVEVSELPFAGITLLVLTARRRGLLMDMICAGISAKLPELPWATATTYKEPFGKAGQDIFFFEEVFAGALTDSGNTLPLAIHQKMVDEGLVQEGGHHVDAEDRFTRVSDIFVGPELQQWRAGKLSNTLFMSEFGAGTRVFLRAA